MRFPSPINRSVRRVLPWVGAAGLLACPPLEASAHADGVPPVTTAAGASHSYALLIGNNQGGPGQEPLRFAESDAGSVAAVLRQLGHYAASDVRVLLHPDAAQVLAALDDVGAKVRANAAHGETSEVVFYYSGHARANAVNLGGEELPLTALRERLASLPSALTIVVLDACQSGSFSRVKGAEPAADFTYNSVTGLTQKGLAVMASSTSQELSQESDELKASYFTHHLITGLRGAGDADGDGRVSLDEAYRYAYRRTLASTARTQVGEQHVTLETNLEGQGEVPVTYPSEARAQLGLADTLDGRVLVQQHGTGAVMAEVQKAPGDPLRLALVAGAYDAVVRQTSGIVQCRVILVDDRTTVLDLSTCTPVAPEKTTSKGGGHDAPPIREQDRWSIEVSAGFMSRHDDSYTKTLQTFGYQPSDGFLSLPPARLTLGVSRAFSRHLVGVFQVGTLAGDTYTRSIENTTDTAKFSAWGGALYLRAQTNLVDNVLGVYGQAGVGVTIGTLDYSTAQTNVPPDNSTTYFGPLVSGAGGMTVRLPALATLFLQVGYDIAPAISNLIGDTHDSGGVSCVVGARFRFGDNL